jgi:predicted RNase H-like HicB family nuclease
MATLECWRDEGWWVGRIREYPDVMTQGETWEDFLENLRDAYETLYPGHRITSMSQTHEMQLQVS